jgi:DNA replication protein DnaC
MRTQDEVDDFKTEATALMEQCPKCEGRDTGCECVLKYALHCRAFEAGIPRDHWEYEDGDVHFNREVFDEVVVPYRKKLRTALKNGYGLLLLGDNGVGKTMFISLVLMRVVRIGFTAFYTTLPQLAHDIKRGFNDRRKQERLDWYLTSDFVAIDEMGKERFREGDSFMRVEVERILKQRYDDARPTLIATNTDMAGLETMYGATLTSIFHGKYQMAVMEPGDYREVLRSKMTKAMRDE